MSRKERRKKYAKAAMVAALSTAMAVTAIPLGTAEVKAENSTAVQSNIIIPKPLECYVDESGEKFTLQRDAAIYINGDAETEEIGRYLQEEFNRSTGYELPVMAGTNAASKDILLATDGAESLGEEGYTLTIGETGIKISAYRPHGIFNGVQTLRQLFPADIQSGSVVIGEWEAPYCEINDKPEYSYRGTMVDSARHFFSVESVKRQIDHMSQYKINKLHLRLADDQGWRLEIKGETETGESYDKLRTIGASTSCSSNGYRPGQYTQEEFQELVEYAEDRYVEIVPEFDMPGHSWAAMVSLEYLNSTEDGKPHSGNYDNTRPYDGWDVGFSTMECRNENTYKFIEEVIRQVAPLYPSEYIHIGGDEAHSTSKEDYTYFMNRVTEIAQKYGKTPLGWQHYDDVVESTVQNKENTVSQYWLTDGAKLKSGLKYVVSPANYAYMDMIYDSSCPYGLQWAGPNPIDDAYKWDPTNYLPEGGTKDQIAGIEAPLFGETIATDEAMDYMVYPRLMGYAEIGWTPKENRNWDEYKNRMTAHGQRLKNMGIGFFEDEKYWEKPVIPVSAVWPMDEGEGTEIQDTGGTYQGTINSDVQWVEGKYGKALKFNNGYVDLNVEGVKKKWTIAMWVNREDNSATNSTLICGDEGEIKLEQYKDTNKVGLTQFGVSDEVFDYEAPVGEWAHLAFVSDGSSTSLYVNGVLTDTIELAINAPINRIGANTKGGLADTGALKGTVDELKIVNRALSEEEVKGLATEGEVPFNTDLLKSALDAASKVTLENYVTAGKEEFENAKAAAEALLTNGAQSQEELNQASQRLDAARMALKLKADKSQLAVQIQNAEKALASQGEYTEESLRALRTVYDKYISVWENDELSTEDQSLVTEAKEALEQAIADLKPAGQETVSKKTLEYFLNKAKEHVANGDTENCVESVKALFEEAIVKGEAVMADEDATKEEVKNAAMKLIKAIHALDMKAGDKTDLQMAVELADMIDLSRYVEAGQKEFTDALNAANVVLEDGDAMQADIDAAWDALTEAMSNLRLKADKTALEELLQEVEGLDLTLYTEESGAVFRSALRNAQDVFADETLTEAEQKTVDDAVKALKEAKDGLVAKADINKPGDGNKPDENKPDGNKPGNGSNTTNNKPVKTGDTAPIGILAAVLLLSGAIILKIRREKA